MSNLQSSLTRDVSQSPNVSNVSNVSTNVSNVSSDVSPNVQSSLTSPSDIDKNAPSVASSDPTPLTSEELKLAKLDLNDDSFIRRYPRTERYWADPPYNNQNFCLFSFAPSKGAQPDKNGIFGMGKFRGAFSNEMEMNQRADWLICNVDSVHKVFHCHVGQPFPITESSAYSARIKRVDPRKDVVQVVSEDIKDKREREYKEMKEIQDREEKLLEQSKDDEVPPDELYTILRVKKAQITWTYLETEKKMKEMKQIIVKTRKEIEDMEQRNPEYKQKYYEKYMNARKKAGIKDFDNKENFLKYLMEDVDLGF